MAAAIPSCGFAQAILTRTEIIPFVTVTMAGHDAGPFDELHRKHLEILSKLTQVCDTKLIGQPVPRLTPSPDVSGWGEKMRRLHHVIRFLENKIYRVLEKRRQYMIRCLSMLIEYLQECPPTPERIYVKVDVPRVMQEVEFIPPKAVSLQNLLERYTREVKQKQKKMKDDRIRKRLCHTLEEMAKNAAQLRYFRLHPLQQKFERLFLSNVMPFILELNKILVLLAPETMNEFTEQMVTFITKCLTDLKMCRKPFTVLLPLLVLRHAFDIAYLKNTFQMETVTDMEKFRALKLGELNPPREFCGPYKPSIKVVTFFRKERRFGKAVIAFEQAMFYTNPFDILWCIDAALAFIHSAAAHYAHDPGVVLPFEATFELLMAVAISSQIPNLPAIAALIDRSSPLFGLCPYFEHPKALLTACAIHLASK